MAIRATDLPQILLDRLGAAAPSPAIFAADELMEWPACAVEVLRRCRLLEETNRATSVVCDGCERGCMKPVAVRARPGGERGARAFVACDEEPDLGRIPVEHQRLLRYSTSLTRLAAFLASALDQDRLLKVGGDGIILLGVLSGRYESRPICLGAKDDEVTLWIGNVSRPLCGVLSWRGGALAVDRKAIRRLADRKPGALTTSVPSTARREGRKLVTRRRHLNWQEEYRRLKRANPRWSDEAIAAEIAATDIGDGRAATTIRRRMKS